MILSRLVSVTVLVVLVGAFVALVGGNYHNGYGNGNANHNGPALTHYGGGECHGHGCYNRHSAPSHSARYGPYHSYAVRPAIYGGHGLYTYKGYARHAPAPRAHYRATRSYGMGSAGHRHRRPARQYANDVDCRGPYCGASSNHHGGRQNYGAHNQQLVMAHNSNNNYDHRQQHYNLRPVKVVALIANNDYENSYNNRAARDAHANNQLHGRQANHYNRHNSHRNYNNNNYNNNNYNYNYNNNYNNHRHRQQHYGASAHRAGGNHHASY